MGCAEQQVNCKTRAPSPSQKRNPIWAWAGIVRVLDGLPYVPFPQLEVEIGTIEGLLNWSGVFSFFDPFLEQFPIDTLFLENVRPMIFQYFGHAIRVREGFPVFVLDRPYAT